MLKHTVAFLSIVAIGTIVMGQENRSADDSWLWNTDSCPIQFSLKETFHGVVATNKSAGTVLMYQLACVTQKGEKRRIEKRLDFVREQILPNQFLMLTEQKYSSARNTCSLNKSKVGVSQVTFSDGAVWLADATLQAVSTSSYQNIKYGYTVSVKAPK